MNKLNLPNRLTLIRILLVPFIIILPLFSYINAENNFLNKVLFEGITILDIIVLVIFVVASITDYLDGHIARSRNIVTDFGKFLDPLADKLLVVSTMIYILMSGMYSGILNKIFGCCVTIIIARELAVTGLRLIASNKSIVIAASKWGKAKTVSQMIMIIVMLIKNLPFSLINVPFDIVLMGVATLLTIVSGVDYFLKNKSVISSM